MALSITDLEVLLPHDPSQCLMLWCRGGFSQQARPGSNVKIPYGEAKDDSGYVACLRAIRLLRYSRARYTKEG